MPSVRVDTYQIKSYDDAKAILDAGRTNESRNRRKIAPHTWLCRHYSQIAGCDIIQVCLYNTNIVTYFGDRIRCVIIDCPLDLRTRLTTDRISRFSRFRPERRKGVWGLVAENGKWWKWPDSGFVHYNSAHAPMSLSAACIQPDTR